MTAQTNNIFPIHVAHMEKACLKRDAEKLKAAMSAIDEQIEALLEIELDTPEAKGNLDAAIFSIGLGQKTLFESIQELNRQRQI